MGLAETAQLVARLDLGGNFLSQVTKVDKSLGGLDRSVSKMGDRWYKAGSQVGTGIKNGIAIGIGAVGLIAANVGVGLRSLEKLEVLTAQTSAVLKSTGGVAGITGAKVEELSKKYEALGGVIDDKVIQNSENLLLTFTNVRKNAFEPALKAILDMNTAMGGGEEGLQKNTILVGKALQDPVRGLTALRRVGVQFTKDQEKQIAALVKTGDVMGAQKIIIGELNREFGGSFLAKGDTTAGKIGRFREAIESLQEALAKALLPTIGEVADKLASFLSSPGTVGAIERLGGQIAGLFSDENIAKGADALKGAFGVVQGILPALKDAASVSGQVLSTAVGLFKSLPPELQKLAIGALAVNKLTGGLVTNVVGGIVGLALNQLKTITAANVTVIGANVAGAGGAAAGGLGAAARGIAGYLGVVGLTLAAGQLIADAIGATPNNPASGASRSFYRNQEPPPTKDAQFTAAASAAAEIGVRAGERASLTAGFASKIIAEIQAKLPKTGNLALTLDEILTGIRSRSATKFGKSLGSAAVDATFQRDLLRTASGIVKSGESTAEKVADLRVLQQKLLENGTAGDKVTADKIQALIETVSTKTPTAQEIAFAIRDQANPKPPTVNVYVTTSTTVSVRDQAIKTKTFSRYGNVAS